MNSQNSSLGHTRNGIFTDERLLARTVARELKPSEVQQIAGGVRPQISYVHVGGKVVPSDQC